MNDYEITKHSKAFYIAQYIRAMLYKDLTEEQKEYISKEFAKGIKYNTKGEREWHGI